MKLYKVLVGALALTLFCVLIMTLSASFGNNGFSSLGVIFALLLSALSCLICLVFTKVSGKQLYKAGFYILHGALVILIVGFLIYRAVGFKATVALPVGGQSYSSIEIPNDKGESKFIDLGFYLGVEDAKTEYYEDGVSPKYYEATLKLTDKVSLRSDNKALSVNHPIRKNGYKIYLMSFASEGEAAVLLIKRNPAEYTIIAGIALVVAGTFIMCLFRRERRDKNA